MHLNQTRIRNAKRLLKDVNSNEQFYLGITINDNTSEIIKNKFHIFDFDTDRVIFPSPVDGIMCRRNAIGEFVPQKDKPKETAYRAQSWELTDWGGNLHSGTNYVPYKRYPRLFIKPKEFKFVFESVKSSTKIFILKYCFTKTANNLQDILFGANLILEIFHEVDTFIYQKDMDILTTSNFETKNWKILPKGEKIWNAFNNHTTEQLSESEHFLINERFNYINSLNPDKIYQGLGGYTDYLVFAFTELNLFIFDSIIYGDAMYIFKNDWENVSKLTKKEILQENLAEERIVHNRQWKKKLNKYFK
jgi:hypothetical protein